MVNLRKFTTLIYAFHFMRFRFNSVALVLFCTFAHHAAAEAAAFGLRLDKTFMAMPVPTEDTPIFIEADRLIGTQNSQIDAIGNAILRKRGQMIRGDLLRYYQESQDLDAQGSVVLEQGGNTMSGPHLLFNMKTSSGTMEQPEYYLADTNGRGSAEVMHIQDRQHFTLDQATYTTCPADNQDWTLKMRGLEIDRERQLGVAHHAWVEFKGVPILYSPWMDFPLNDQRKSGFLAPIFGSTSKGGSELTMPYYWNIAENRDATIAPRVMAKRGVLLNNEFRYLEPTYSGEAHVDVLPNDALAKRNRTHMSLLHSQNFGGGLSGYLNLNTVSDDAYFVDLADTVSVTSQVNLLQEGVLSYNAGWWNASARVQRYQTLAPIGQPYKRLPQLVVNASQSYSGAAFNFTGEFVDFSHPTAINAKRLMLNPSVSYPLIKTPAYYVTPKFAVHSRYYAMGANNFGGLPNASRTLPILSVDSGVAFERDTNLFGSEYVHTLEPRAFYVYVPYKNQSSLPTFDSAQTGFGFSQMFTENRFVGNDTVGDANQMTLALTSRFVEQASGVERLSLMVGQRISFKTPQIAPTTSNKSNVLLAAYGRLTDTLNFDSALEYDPNTSHAQNYNAAAHYRPEVGKTLNMGYRFTRNSLRQVDISAQWPLFKRWHAVGRWNYSLQDARMLETIAGLEYNQDCWTLRFVAQSFTTGTKQTNTGFFVQLELNDFVKVGSDPLNVLKQSIQGYTKLNDKPVSKPSQVLR